MKFNWGTGIAVFYILFMVILVSVVIKTKSYDHSLVMNNYYEEDLKYQQQYDKLANTQAMDTPVLINQQPDKVTIQFPKEMEGVNGEVWMFRPSNAKQDFRLPIQVSGENVMEIPTGSMSQGRWKIKVDWQSSTQKFYKEETIVL